MACSQIHDKRSSKLLMPHMFLVSGERVKIFIKIIWYTSVLLTIQLYSRAPYLPFCISQKRIVEILHGHIEFS